MYLSTRRAWREIDEIARDITKRHGDRDPRCTSLHNTLLERKATSGSRNLLRGRGSVLLQRITRLATSLVPSLMPRAPYIEDRAVIKLASSGNTRCRVARCGGIHLNSYGSTGDERERSGIDQESRIAMLLSRFILFSYEFDEDSFLPLSPSLTHVPSFSFTL